MENILNAAGKAIVFILALTWPTLQSTAQDAGDPSGSGDKKKKTRIIIVKDEDGKIVKTDTTVMGDGTFVFSDHDFDFDFDFDMPDMEGLMELNEFKFDDAHGNAFEFDDQSQLTDEEKVKLKEEMEKAHKEMQKARKEMREAREEMRKKQHEAIKEELKKARKEMKELNREELENEMEKLREELLELKHNQKSGRHMKWKQKGGPNSFRVMVDEDGNSDHKKCLIIMNGDTIVCKGMAGCKDWKTKARCGGLDGKKVRIMKFRDGDDASEEVIIEKIVKEAPEDKAATPASPASPAEPAAPAEQTAPATPEPEEIPGQAAKHEVVNASEQKIALHDLHFYPNPTSGQFRLSFRLDTPGKATIRLIDYAGRELFNEEAIDFPGTYSKQFDVSGSARGSYLLMISQGDKWVHEKLVVG